MKKILIISSFPITHSAGLAEDYALALEKAGYEVVFFTRFKEHDGKHKIWYVYEDKNQEEQEQKRKQCIEKKHFSLENKISKYLCYRRRASDGASFLYDNIGDYNYPIQKDLLLRTLPRNNYVSVIVLFFSYMVSDLVLADIYNYLKAPIYVYTIDMFFATGACYYPGTCSGYINGCLNCRYYTKCDRSRISELANRKAQSLLSSHVTIVANSWTKQFFEKSLIGINLPIIKQPIVINEQLFMPKDISFSRDILKLPPIKKFIILCGAKNIKMKRKGGEFLLKAIKWFSRNITKTQKDQVLLVTMGNDILPPTLEGIDVFNLGFVGLEKLAFVYSASSVFVSSSVDDAGPSTVNQSLMCGTPVISFNIGTALDVIHNNKTGFAVELRDYVAMGRSLLRLFQMPDNEYLKMRKECRKLSLSISSIDAISKSFEQILP